MISEATNIYEVFRPLEWFLKLCGIIPILSRNNLGVLHKLLNVSFFVINVVVGATVSFLLSQYYHNIIVENNITDFNLLFICNQYYQMITLGVPLIPILTNHVLARQNMNILHYLHESSRMVGNRYVILNFNNKIIIVIVGWTCRRQHTFQHPKNQDYRVDGGPEFITLLHTNHNKFGSTDHCSCVHLPIPVHTYSGSWWGPFPWYSMASLVAIPGPQQCIQVIQRRCIFKKVVHFSTRIIWIWAKRRGGYHPSAKGLLKMYSKFDLFFFTLG